MYNNENIEKVSRFLGKYIWPLLSFSLTLVTLGLYLYFLVQYDLYVVVPKSFRLMVCLFYFMTGSAVQLTLIYITWQMLSKTWKKNFISFCFFLSFFPSFFSSTSYEHRYQRNMETVLLELNAYFSKITSYIR